MVGIQLLKKKTRKKKQREEVEHGKKPKLIMVLN
jgi:hypothetical protein